MEQILNLNVKKEFNQKNFQQATSKILKDKKTLVMSPSRINVKMLNRLIGKA
jgi:hypothetical protein